MNASIIYMVVIVLGAVTFAMVRAIEATFENDEDLPPPISTRKRVEASPIETNRRRKEREPVVSHRVYREE